MSIYVEFDHDDQGRPRYTLHGVERGRSVYSIRKTMLHTSETWAEDLLKWFEGDPNDPGFAKIPDDTPIHIGQHVTAETVGDIIDRVKEFGRDR